MSAPRGPTGSSVVLSWEITLLLACPLSACCATRSYLGEIRGTECGNDRLPAERLEQAITRRLWKVINDFEARAGELAVLGE
jgi:hypothetical protein